MQKLNNLLFELLAIILEKRRGLYLEHLFYLDDLRLYVSHVKGSRSGHFVKISLWYASLLTNTIFAFFILE